MSGLIEARFNTRLAIPVVAMTGAVGLAAITSSGRMSAGPIEVVLGLAGALGLAASVRQLGFGVAMLPLVAAAVPFALGTGTQSTIVAGLLFAVLLLGVWGTRAILDQDFTLVRSPINAPTIGLMLIWVVAYLYSNAVRPPEVRIWPGFPVAQAGGVALVLISAGALLLAANAGRELPWIRASTWGLIGLGAFGVAAFFLNLESTASFLNTGGLFTLWVVALAYGQALFNERLPWLARIGLAGLVAAWMYKAAVVQSLWLSGWIPPLFAIVVITLMRSRAAFGALIIAMAIGLFHRFDLVYEAVWESQVAEGDLTRLDIWGQAWDLLRQYPLFGTGPAGYSVYYMTYYIGSEFSMSTHSNYVDIAAQTGLVGALIFVWFSLAMVVVGLRACRRWRSGFAAGYAHGAFGGLIGVLVAMSLGDWFIPFVYNQTIVGFRYTAQSWVYLGFLAGLATLQPDSKTDPA
jgi:O-antigen ligase